MRALLTCLALILGASPAAAQPTLGLAAPRAVVDSGLLHHILPRFSLKTSIRIRLDTAGAMQLADRPPGIAVFHGGGATYFLRIRDDPRQRRFRDWLTSEIGKTAIERFAPDGQPPFSARFDTAEPAPAPEFRGDAARGARLSLTHCGRCHVIGPRNRMNGLGSTPSFAVLRGLGNWERRFREFFLRPPHAAFTQIEGVTQPFDPQHPPPIVPVRITPQDLKAILAFAARIRAADLGGPLHAQ